ncbi:MAG: NIL domain-containing protein [Elusimicrobiota bacterium]
MKKRLELIFPQNQIKEPVICRMAREFGGLVFNIRRARVTEKVGEMVLELDGPDADVEDALDWLRKQQIRVEPVTHDAVEG